MPPVLCVANLSNSQQEFAHVVLSVRILANPGHRI